MSWLSVATEHEVHEPTYVVDFERFYAIREWNLLDDTQKKQLRALNRIADALSGGPGARITSG